MYFLRKNPEGVENDHIWVCLTDDPLTQSYPQVSAGKMTGTRSLTKTVSK